MRKSEIVETNNSTNLLFEHLLESNFVEYTKTDDTNYNFKIEDQKTVRRLFLIAQRDSKCIEFLEKRYL
jgi:hypothetical protein